MQVYKFGGASIATPARMQALLPIIRQQDGALVIVVSAMGKATNALEAIVKAACSGNKGEANSLVQQLEQQHLDYAMEVLDAATYNRAKQDLTTYFTELQWAVDDADSAHYDYSYDQIVCLGEILSTKICSYYLASQNIPHQWVDIRDVIRTDDTFRDARVDVDYTTARAKAALGGLLAEGQKILTQGFIGATDDNASVTLGREGSDYTAALLASMLGAESVTIWKDVEGLLTADPKLFPDTVKIEAITYHEVIEMAYYGAQVIHPKTIKPLKNNNIPLHVKCFLDKELAGTVIQGEVQDVRYPPIIVLKQSQVLVQVTTRDFSFMTEDNLSSLYSTFHALKIKVNLIQNAAISFVACIDNSEEKLAALIAQLSADYKVTRNENVSLLTIRHYTLGTLANLTADREILLQQTTRSTVQVVMKDV